MEQQLVIESNELDEQLLRSEWPAGIYKGIYLNSGSCGVKPKSVLTAIQNGWNKLNENPTLMSFIETEVWDKARAAAAQLCNVQPNELMIIPNSTFGIQLIMQSLLLNPGDELVTSDQEHRCVNTLGRYLQETRGIVVRKHETDPHAGSQRFCRGVLDLVGKKTKLVLVSQINCLTGWRPCLDELCRELKSAGIPLLVDGAHAPGQGPLQIQDYPFWISSCHKWMGAPNGLGLLKAAPEYMERLAPLLVGDRYYEHEFALPQRLEWSGTCDVVRLEGLQAAVELQLKLGPENIAKRQLALQKYLRDALQSLPAGTIRTPDLDGERSAMLTIYWNKKQLNVEHLRSALWQEYQIWIQPDFVSNEPGHGIRVACNVFNKESEIDALIAALHKLIN